MTGEENGNPRANGFMRGFLGGHPLAVFLRLALISFLVGIVLSVFGVTPKNFFDSLDAFARFLYDLDAAPEAKIEAVARTIYGADGLEVGRAARQDLERVHALGYDRLPVCIAKTHLSLSGDPRRVGRPRAFRLPLDSVRIAAGAGYLLALTGDIVTMPGLPREPAAWQVDLDDTGEVTGL